MLRWRFGLGGSVRGFDGRWRGWWCDGLRRRVRMVRHGGLLLGRLCLCEVMGVCVWV